MWGRNACVRQIMANGRESSDFRLFLRLLLKRGIVTSVILLIDLPCHLFCFHFQLLILPSCFVLLICAEARAKHQKSFLDGTRKLE